jgi:cell wall-associated NlpC family hydrolase
MAAAPHVPTIIRLIMRMSGVSRVVILSTAFWAGAVIAQPAAPSSAPSLSSDEMASFLQDKGLVEKLGEQVRAASSAISDKASELVVAAMGFLGVPYKRGGNSFDQGLDCSGFVRLIYEQSMGLVLPRRSAEQAAATQPIEASELQPGDLVFFNTLRSAFSHVGIYVGQNKFIHAPRSGAVVRVEDMTVPYWRQRFDGARRVDASWVTVKTSEPAGR